MFASFLFVLLGDERRDELLSPIRGRPDKRERRQPLCLVDVLHHPPFSIIKAMVIFLIASNGFFSRQCRIEYSERKQSRKKMAKTRETQFEQKLREIVRTTESPFHADEYAASLTSLSISPFHHFTRPFMVFSFHSSSLFS